MMLVYLIILLETTGTWFVVSTITEEELDEKRLNRASFGEGLGCLVGSLFGSTPLTGYSSNAGLLAITGVGSRMVIMASGFILVLLDSFPNCLRSLYVFLNLSLTASLGLSALRSSQME